MSSSKELLLTTLQRRLQYHSDQFFDSNVSGINEHEVKMSLSMIQKLNEPILRTNALKTLVQFCPTSATIMALHEDTATRIKDDDCPPFLLSVMTYNRYGSIKSYLQSLTDHRNVFPLWNVEVLVFDFSTNHETVEKVKNVVQQQQRLGLKVRHVPAHSLLLFANTVPEVWGLSLAQEIRQIAQLVPYSPEWTNRLMKLGYSDFRNLSIIYLRHHLSGRDLRTIVGFNDDDLLFQNCIADMVTSELRMEFVYDIFETVARYMKKNPGSVLCGGNSLSPPNSAEMLYSTTLYDLMNAASADSEMDGRNLRLSLLTETYNMHGGRGNSLCKTYNLECPAAKPTKSFQTRLPFCQQSDDGLLGYVNVNCCAFLSGNLITRPIVAPPLGRMVNFDLSIDVLSRQGPHGTLGNVWVPASIVTDRRFIVPEFGSWRGEDIGLLSVINATIAPVIHTPICLGHWRDGFRRNLRDARIFTYIQDSLCGYVMHRIFEDANDVVQQQPGVDFFEEIEKILSTKISSVFYNRQKMQQDMLSLVQTYVDALLERPNIEKYQNLCITLNRFRLSIDDRMRAAMDMSNTTFIEFARHSISRLRRWHFAPDIKLTDPICGLGQIMTDSSYNFRSEILEEFCKPNYYLQEEAHSFLRSHFGVDWQSPRLALSCLCAGSSLLKYVVAALEKHDYSCVKQQLEILAGNDYIGLWFALRGFCELAITSQESEKEVRLITAVIPVFRRGNDDATETVRNTLKLLLPLGSYSKLPFSVSVIVIDNGCGKDGIQPCVNEVELEHVSRILGFTRISILRPNRNIGPVGGRNLGTTIALFDHQTDAVLWIDDDPIEISGLDVAVKNLDNNSCVTGFIFLDNCSEQTVTFYGGKNSLKDPFPMVPYHALESHLKLKRNVWAFFGGLCLINRTTLLRCGLFDRRIFAYWEEFELSGRMLKVQENIRFCPSFTITYRSAHTGNALNSNSVAFHDMRNQVLSLRVHGYLPIDLCGGRLTVQSVEQNLVCEVDDINWSGHSPCLLEKIQGLKSGKECSLDVPLPHLDWTYTIRIDTLFLQSIENSLKESSVSVPVWGFPVKCNPTHPLLTLGGWETGVTCGFGAVGDCLLGQAMYYVDNAIGDGRAALIGHVSDARIPGTFVKFHDVRVKGIGCTPCANICDSSHSSGALPLVNAYITAARHQHLIALGIPSGKVPQIWEITEEKYSKSELPLPFQMMHADQSYLMTEILPSNVRVSAYEVHYQVTKNVDALKVLFGNFAKRLGFESEDPNRLLAVAIHMFAHTAAVLQANFVAHQSLTAGNISEVGLPLDLDTCDILTLPCGDYGFEPHWKFYMQPTQLRELALSMHQSAVFAYVTTYKLSEDQVVAMFNTRFNNSFTRTFSLNFLGKEEEETRVSYLYHQLTLTQSQYQKSSSIAQEIAKLTSEYSEIHKICHKPLSFLTYRDLVEGSTLPGFPKTALSCMESLYSLGSLPLSQEYVRQRYHEIVRSNVAELLAPTWLSSRALITDTAIQKCEKDCETQDIHLYDDIGGRSQCANYQPGKWERFLSNYHAKDTILRNPAALSQQKLAARMKELTLGLFGLFRPLPTGRCNDFQISSKFVDEEDSFVSLPSTNPEDCLKLTLTIHLGTDLEARVEKIVGAIINAASDVVLAWNDKVHTKQVHYTSDIKNPYSAAILYTNQHLLERWIGQSDFFKKMISKCEKVVDDKYQECEELLKELLSAFENVNIKMFLKWLWSFYRRNPCHFMRYVTEESHGLAHTVELFRLLRNLKMFDIGENVFGDTDDITACVLSSIVHDITQLWWDKNGEAHPLTAALNAQNLFAETEMNSRLVAKTIFCILHHSSQDVSQLLNTYRSILISKGRFISFASLPKYKQAIKLIEDYGIIPEEHLPVVTLFKCVDNLAALNVRRMVELPSPPRKLFSAALTLKSRVESIFSSSMRHRALIYDRLNNVIYAHTRKLALVSKDLGIRFDCFVESYLQSVVQLAPGLMYEQARKEGCIVEPSHTKTVILEAFKAFAELAPADPRFEGICFEPWKELFVNE